MTSAFRTEVGGGQAAASRLGQQPTMGSPPTPVGRVFLADEGDPLRRSSAGPTTSSHPSYCPSRSQRLLGEAPRSAAPPYLPR
jgi:hypothetical protein